MSKYKTETHSKIKSSSLLIDDKPMMALPRLLHRLGSDRALILQQLHYWVNLFEECGNERMYKDGRWWVFNTIPEWQQKQFTWLTVKVVGNILRELEKMGLITSKKFYKAKWCQKKWYSLNYDEIATLAELDIAFVDHPIKELVEMVSKRLNTLENSNVSQETIVDPLERLSIVLQRDDDLRDYKEESNYKETKNNIDTFLEQKSDCNDFHFKTDISSGKSKKQVGLVSSGTDQQYSGGRETHETQNETAAPPKKKINWRPGQTLYYETDQNDRIIYPHIKDIHPSVKYLYNGAIIAADQETKAWIINNGFVNAVRVEVDEAGATYVETLNGDYTPQEALSDIPLAQLFQLGVHPDYGSLSAKEYNEYWAERFIEYMSSMEDVPL